MTNMPLNLSLTDLLARQVYGLVRETAEVVQPEGNPQNPWEIEFALLDHVTQYCAAKCDHIKAVLAETAKPQKPKLVE